MLRSLPPLTGPSLSNAHRPVQTANAPSLARMVLPVTLMFTPSDQTLMAASGVGFQYGSSSRPIPRYRPRP